jgi:hypothetical protein
MDTVIDEVAKEFNIPVNILTSRCRTNEVARARFALYKVLTMAGYTTTQIGAKIGRDHSSVVVGLQRIDNDEELWKRALKVYQMCYDIGEYEFESRIKHRLLFDKIKRQLNEGKEKEIKKNEETEDIIFKIKHGAQKKVPNYKNGTYRTIYL